MTSSYIIHYLPLSKYDALPMTTFLHFSPDLKPTTDAWGPRITRKLFYTFICGTFGSYSQEQRFQTILRVLFQNENQIRHRERQDTHEVVVVRNVWPSG